MEKQTNVRIDAQTISKIGIYFALLVISSKIAIPIPFYDYISLQTAFIFLIYPILGAKYGSWLTILYLVSGLLGLPIFASGGGLGYVFRVTFGFLIAFTLMPFFATIVRKGNTLFNHHRFLNTLISNYICLVMIHLIGFVYKCLIIKFYIGDTIKVTGLLGFTSLIDFMIDIILIFFVTLAELQIIKRLH
ncbi:MULTISPECIES: biotin transporter BioY [Leuconostoc]|uniref:Biotin transporter n=2 Tax=Leuconostoc kimchii TaxID=136609 RepID=D5T2T7_LEUKI|nr:MULTISPECIES: biotin transporter BioY [Leuconostoc]ADG40586.1 biotin synthase [Leuconostoc kimchii IMSNU 11154]AEJ31490.1 biotin synthase [Leuconostoc sp. C2]QBR47049.1 biotin transporter BioY [Leuconostoc kimchii]